MIIKRKVENRRSVRGQFTHTHTVYIVRSSAKMRRGPNRDQAGN